MVNLYENLPNRIFTFGCSFTSYRWATWSNILGYEFKNAEFYNYGKSGAGNQYISNMITQADCIHNFKEDDLVIVSWTNVSREDRYLESRQGWVTPGNIYSQNEYDKNFVKKWANDTHFVLRDYSTISTIYEFLKNKTQFHFISMCDLSYLDQWTVPDKANTNPHIDFLNDIYSCYINKIYPSFYKILWENDMDRKWQQDWDNVHPHFSDGHPLPLEHLQYLQETFDYTFSNKTIDKVHETQKELVLYIQNGYKNTKRPIGIYEFSENWLSKINQNFKLRQEHNDNNIHS